MKKIILLGLVLLGSIFNGCNSTDKKEEAKIEETKKVKSELNSYIKELQEISRNSENHKRINLEK